MDDEELEKQGERIFEKMHQDDKRALKHFITRQIQNVLANEHGIGGRRQSVEAIDKAVAAHFDRPALIDRLGRWILGTGKIDAKATIDKALAAAAKQAVTDVVGEAAKNITVTFHIGTPPPENAPANWGKFE